jgi:Ca2+-transporting ATPase
MSVVHFQNHVSQSLSRHDRGLNVAIPLHTAVTGRARFRVPQLYRNAHLKQNIETTLGDVNGIRSVQANLLTSTLLITYRQDISLDDICSVIHAKLGFEVKSKSQPFSHSVTIPGTDFRTIFKPSTILKPFPRPKKKPPRPELVVNVDADIPPWHTVSATKVLRELGSSKRAGLSTHEASERLAKFGPNALPVTKPRSELDMFTEQFMSLPVGMLGVSAVVSILTGGVLDAAAIVGVVMTNALIGYFTERQSERTINSLANITPKTAPVRRAGKIQEVPVEQLVAGDIVLLAPGTYVAADARLLEETRLTLDESPLTGESMPVAKDAKFIGEMDTPIGDRKNMVYMGTMVTGGSGRGVVVGTGRRSELGTIHALVGKAKPPETPMEKQLDRMGTQLVLLSSAVCGGVFVLGLLRGVNFLQMLKTSISLAVAAVPEGLPTVATTTLALGIRDMRKRRVLIRQLDAVETLGSVQVLCLDKTGTLTQNRMQVSSIYVGSQQIAILESAFYSAGKLVDPHKLDELLRLLHVVSLCSETKIDPATRRFENGSPTENALVETALKAHVDVAALRKQYPLSKMQHRSEGRHYMVSWHGTRKAGHFVAVKGSPAEVLAKCRWYMQAGEQHELTDEMRATISAANDRMAGDALRVLGAAFRYAENAADSAEELVWLGLIGMADPVRSGTDALMGVFHRAGIKTVMITGDQSATAYAIGRQLNLSNGKALEIMDSSSLEKVDPELMAGLAQKVHVFARVSPAHKLRIVEALQKAGKVVAMTGDGINDGPALKAADLGIAMGSTGTDVARSLSDVVLEQDDLDTMVVAVRQGRSTYNNIRKALHYLLSTNMSEIEVMVVVVALGAGQALTPIQLLWINLITDIFPGLALAMESPEPDAMDKPPRDPNEPIIRKQDFKRLGLESAVITAGALGSYGYGLWRYGPGPQSGTMAFSTLTIAQILHALSCRSETHSIYDKTSLPPNRYLNLAIGGSLLAQVLASVIPGIRKFLGLTPIGLLDALVIGAGATIPLLINDATKKAQHHVQSKVNPNDDSLHEVAGQGEI